MTTQKTKAGFPLRLNSKLKEGLERLAAAEDRSLNSYIVQILKRQVEAEIGRLREQLAAFDRIKMRTGVTTRAGRRDTTNEDKQRLRSQIAELEKILAS